MCDRLFPEYIQTSALPRDKCIIIREDKLPRFDWRYAVMLTLPYYVGGGDGTLAEFASHEDYHAVLARLEIEVRNRLSELGIDANVKLMTDNSPLDEVSCAAFAGLGMIGEHRMLITPRYSSYVFIGEIFTDMTADVLERLGVTVPGSFELKRCEGCGRCTAACPAKEAGEACLSELTQKKRELSDGEARLIAKCGSAWGCDICTEACPHTAEARRAGTLETPYPPFLNDHILGMTSAILENMSDEEYAEFAFSWRPRRVIARNLKLIEDAKNAPGNFYD